MKNGINHVGYYFVELFVLLLGFFVLLVFPTQIFVQLAILTGVLLAYIAIGLFHHASNHDLKRKIALEYILVSAIIFGAFLFLNANRL